MKVVLTRFGSVFLADGINAFIWALSDALIGDGQEVYVIGGHNGSEKNGAQANLRSIFDVEKEPKVFTLSRSIGPQNGIKECLQWFRRGSRLLNKISPDMLIANGAFPLYSSAFKVTVSHDLEFRRSRVQKYYDMLLYRIFDAVVTTSTELRQKIVSELRLDPYKVFKIPICINTRKYSSSDFNQRKRAILHVGVKKEKNLETTANAFCIIAKREPAMKLFIVGPPSDELRRVLSKIKESDIKRRIFYFGVVSKAKLKNLYSTVTVTSVPSVYRVPVLSPTVLESFASGTPVVGSSSAISGDLLIDGYNGFRVHSQDATSLAARITTLLGNVQLWKRMSKNALVTAKSFDAPFVARSYVKLYSSFLS